MAFDVVFTYRYVLFTTNLGKRNLKFSDVTTQLLTNWQNTEVNVFIHIYSLNVSSQNLFKKIKKQLIDPANVDRAGAASNSMVREVADNLKEVHKFHFVGPDIAWTIWANQLMSMEPYERDAAINEPPPGKLIELFNRAMDPADHVLRGLQRNVSIGRTVSNLKNQEIQECRAIFDDMVDLMKRAQLKAVELDNRLKLMEQTAVTSSELLSTINEAVEESEFSGEFFERIQNQEDVDHM